MESKTVLVTGIGGNVGQGILRNIRALDLDITLIGTDIESFTAANYLCHKTYKVPYAYDAKYISTIQGIVENENIDLIIPSTDFEVYYLSLNANVIACQVLASDASISEIYLDKYKTFLHHKKLDIPFAQSFLPEEYDYSFKDIIAKPRKGRGSRGIVINPKNLKELPDDYMIQPLVKGIEITTAAYITKENKLHGVFSMERELTNGTTSKSKVIKTYDDKFTSIIEKMINNKGFRGSINIQSIVDKEGDIYPFEVNCRISGTNSIRHNLGFQDVKYAIQEHLFNVQPDEPKPINGIATRILLDVIYPEAIDENVLSNMHNKHIIY